MVESKVEEWTCDEIMGFTNEQCYTKFNELIESLRRLLETLELGLRSVKGYKEVQRTIIDYSIERHKIYTQIDNIFLKITLNNDKTNNHSGIKQN